MDKIPTRSKRQRPLGALGGSKSAILWGKTNSPKPYKKPALPPSPPSPSAARATTVTSLASIDRAPPRGPIQTRPTAELRTTQPMPDVGGGAPELRSAEARKRLTRAISAELGGAQAA
eukprot:441051-Pyramimonas_sp.AAC.1